MYQLEKPLEITYRSRWCKVSILHKVEELKLTSQIVSVTSQNTRTGEKNSYTNNITKYNVSPISGVCKL